MDAIHISLFMRQGIVVLNAADADFSQKLMAAQQENDRLLGEEHATALTASAERGDAYRDVLAGEIIRCEQLAAPKDKDGKVQYDAKTQLEYYAGLPAVRLKMEFDRRPLPKVEKPTIPGAEIPASDDVYAKELGLSDVTAAPTN